MGRKLALIIGNSEYDGASLSSLITPSEDVNDLAVASKSPDAIGMIVTHSAVAVMTAPWNNAAS